jgi:hypothetical protein
VGAGNRQWLVEAANRPGFANLRRTTDPLFRQAGIDLDEADTCDYM